MRATLRKQFSLNACIYKKYCFCKDIGILPMTEKLCFEVLITYLFFDISIVSDCLTSHQVVGSVSCYLIAGQAMFFIC